jgi:hydroxyacylglutathione hydrolase
LFCGDLIYNFFGKPGCLFINDLADFDASVEKLKKSDVKTVYPGHGKPFPLEQFISQASRRLQKKAAWRP